ncbi:alpha/beta fold hydrolase [Glacieibacterium frigidum]|uniref:Alpha/beta hydrolase n=1 Tax=Glacieibacterium frigidum TaxID=2593303 RepID=A0A552U8A9_9SPHN|nr:alpha/beta hydrolase [Glacieibacterium frigidum]TRW14455.1 alpha/beta hydrolase [Glacieibacterium frigidum]
MKPRAILAAAALLLAAAAPVPPQLTVQQLRAQYMTPADKIVTIGGVEVRYRDQGKGPVLLLLHGSNSTLDTWDGVAAKLVRKYRVIRFDLPPLGLSGPISDAAKATLSGPDALMTGFLDHLKVKSVVAIGVSSGGTMAYYLAAKYPERVRALIVSNSPSDPVDTSGVVNSPELDAAIARSKAAGGYRDREYFRAYFRFLYGDPARLTETQIDRVYTMIRRQTEPNFLHLHALAGNNAETLSRLGKVKVPTLLIWGTTDKVLPLKAGLRLRDHLTATTPSILLLDDVGHYPPIEVPDRFAAIVEAYLSQVLPAPQ